MGKRDGGKGSGKSKDDRDSKDSLCRTIQRGGTCRYGDECKFSHDAEAFNDDGSKRKSRSSQNQIPATSGITEEEWGLPVGLKSNSCGYAKQYPVPFAADSASQKMENGWMSASAAVAKPAAKGIGALPELPEGSRILTFNYDTGERYLSVEGLWE